MCTELCRLVLCMDVKKKKFRKPSYTNFTRAMSWKLIGLLAKMLKTTEG